MGREHVEPYLELDGICRNPIFVIGSPRSGTTALAQSLNRVPELRVGKESYILHELFGEEKAERSWRRHIARLTPSWLKFEEVEHDEFLFFLGLGINALFSSRAEGKRWIDQTPLYTPMAPTLAAMFPGAQFIHIVRDGRHVVRSMLNFERKFDGATIKGAQPNEIPKWSSDFHVGCETWAAWVAAGLDFSAQQPERCLTVWNEQLSADPVGGFEAIHDWLGIRRHPGSANFFSKQRLNSSWVRDLNNRPDDDDWSGWDRRRRHEFVAVAGDTMVRAGYGPVDALRDWARG